MEIQRIINSHEFLEFRKGIVDTVMSKAPLLYLHDGKGPLSEPGDSGRGVFLRDLLSNGWKWTGQPVFMINIPREP